MKESFFMNLNLHRKVNKLSQTRSQRHDPKVNKQGLKNGKKTHLFQRFDDMTTCDV